MSSTYYRLYVNQVFELVKTFVVKSSMAADTINKELMLSGIEVSPDPRAWKYYMNLSGLYHHTDKLMTVTSVDTLETIEFTQENLLIHRATATAYQYGSRYYQDLVNRYPTQENLIFGILNPVELERAVDAEEGTILYYNQDLIEPQEDSLLLEIQDWIYSFHTRWHVLGYSITDELYPAAFLGVLFSQLPTIVLNARLARCRTPEVHSFHIREYLASHNRLDVFVPYLTLKQQLFLYRNLRYIQRHPGHQATFNWLMTNLMDPRRLPLARYDMVHRTDDMETTLTPIPTMERVSLNGFPSDGSDDLKSVSDLMEKQYQVARNNRTVHFDEVAPTEAKIKTSTISRLPTKSLESALLDTTDSVPFTREEVLLNHWLLLASNDRFTAVINVANPKTGTTIRMSPKDAFIVYLYAVNKTNGIQLTHIPTLWASRVQKSTLPTLANMRALVDSEKVPDTWLSSVRVAQPAMGTYLSIQAFREFIEVMYRIQNQQRDWWCAGYERDERAMKEAAISSLYHDTAIQLGDSAQTYEEWFAERGYDFYDLNDLDSDLLYRNIIQEVGGDIVTTSSQLAILQRETLRLMERLSSYSVHYIQSINNTAYRILDTRYVRDNDNDNIHHTRRFVSTSRVHPLATTSRIRSKEQDLIYSRRGIAPQSISDSQMGSRYEIDPTIDVRADNHGTYHYWVPINHIRARVMEELTTDQATLPIQIPA